MNDFIPYKLKRSLPEGRKMSNSQSPLNSVDAQTFVDANPGLAVIRPPSDPNRKPQGVNASPLRMILKQLGVFGPVVESLVDMIDGGGLRELLDSFKLGSYVDRYQRLADDYAEEFDAGHCFFEYFTFTVFNNRFAQKSTSRGLEDDAVGLMLKAATTLLKSDNSSQILTSLFSMFPSRPAVREESMPIQQPTPDIQEVAMNIARFYLRNYFSTLSGSTVRVDDQDPANNPESLADMIEQVSRPVFLSIFGVVPGVPASGKLDHLLVLASKDRKPEFRNKLVPIEPTRPVPVIKTGNPFFDFGNSIVATFQRASDATHGLYCVKQYMVNKMWDGFRGSMRRMMRAIPSAG